MSLLSFDLGAHYRNIFRPASISAVRSWLFAIAAFVFAMVLVGGATRLTGSGLSITEWQPILGALPPLSDADWQAAFAKYKTIPQYDLVNNGMSLADFKGIYWWEWSHRLLGRLIGVIFFVPFAAFLVLGSIPRGYIFRIALLFLLGASQGALGWFMVKSGLANRVDVSQYRLAAHLGLAVVIMGYAFWLAMSLPGRASPKTQALNAASRNDAATLAVSATILAASIYMQIVIGGFVAGLKAGLASNTWPLMNGAIIPDGINALSPWYMNLFENPLTVQFIHRLTAYIVAMGAAILFLRIWRNPAYANLRLPVSAVCISILMQIALGVETIFSGVQLGLALAHQASAMILFALALWLVRRTLSQPSSMEASA